MEAFRKRLIAFALVILAFLGLAFFRLLQLQVWDQKKYARFSQGNTLRDVNLPAPRGKILDRNGRVLAENRPSFVLTVQLSQVEDLEKTVATLAHLLESEPQEIRERLANKKNVARLGPVSVAQDLDRDRVAKLRARMGRIAADPSEQWDLRGVELGVRYERVYPLKEKIGHVLGYVREVSDRELADWEKREPGRVRSGDKVGVAGVEKTFDLELRGYDGYRQTFVDALGREVDLSDLGFSDALKVVPARAGEDLKLSLDERLMAAADAAFANKVGALVALDPRNGQILAMLSKPSYNPQEMSEALSNQRWKELQENPDKILINRPTQASYPPGSTYKIVTAVAGLVEGLVDFKHTETCPGYYEMGGRRWGCWNKRGHGRVNLHQALVSSCDVFFYKLGEKLGPDRLARYAMLLGLGKKTGVLSDSEREGLVPTSDWKERVKKQKWTGGDSLGIAIGQGYDLVTPLQNALMIAQFANGGKKITPHLRLEESPPKAERMEGFVNDRQFELLRQALIDVVQAPTGTGGRARVPGIEVGGKTGTAQVVGEERKGQLGKDIKTGDHAWFVAFAPKDPEIAIAVIVEHAGHGGSEAAPIAQKVLAEYFKDRLPAQELKKNAKR